jgi:hypothetical protein
MPSFTLPFFEWSAKTWLGIFVRDHVWAFPVIETFHLLSLAILLGSVFLVNLRAFGLGRRFSTLQDLARELEPWMITSIGVLILTGIPMMLSEPMKCYESYSFPVKMTLMLVGIALHFSITRKWASGAASPSRITAAFSIALWTTVSLAGKGIPYI